ncbi:MAG: hypothetical protein K2O88_01730 [Paramuribaculum sp.]|nr:hypothetical protein [Paramuribaculum sp.]
MNNSKNHTRLETISNRHPKQPLANEKNSVPGQQLGLYSDNEEKDFDQMTCTLNNPEENSQNDRG